LFKDILKKEKQPNMACAQEMVMDEQEESPDFPIKILPLPMDSGVKGVNKRRKPVVSTVASRKDLEDQDKGPVALLDQEEDVQKAIAVARLAEPFTRREQWIVEKHEKILTRNTIVNLIAPIVDKKSSVSLRDLHYAVTSFFPDQHTTIQLDPESFPVAFDDLYELWLSSYHKDFFDPFRRGRHVLVVCEQDPNFAFETTLGQLKFFIWAYEHYVIQYVSAHLPDIKAHMNAAIYKRRMENTMAAEKKTVPLGKRRPLLQYKERGYECFYGNFDLKY
jgi:hypothetical protein